MSPNLIGTLPASTKPTRVQIWVVRPAGSRIFRNETLSGAATARERIMHGSDWMMGAIQANADAYYEDFQGVFQGVEKKSPGVTKQFFVANAVPTSVSPPATLRASASTNISVTAAGRPAVWTTRR